MASAPTLAASRVQFSSCQLLHDDVSRPTLFGVPQLLEHSALLVPVAYHCVEVVCAHFFSVVHGLSIHSSFVSQVETLTSDQSVWEC